MGQDAVPHPEWSPAGSFCIVHPGVWSLPSGSLCLVGSLESGAELRPEAKTLERWQRQEVRSSYSGARETPQRVRAPGCSCRRPGLDSQHPSDSL